jgi:hypothetical protein
MQRFNKQKTEKFNVAHFLYILYNLSIPSGEIGDSGDGNVVKNTKENSNTKENCYVDLHEGNRLD